MTYRNTAYSVKTINTDALSSYYNSSNKKAIFCLGQAIFFSLIA